MALPYQPRAGDIFMCEFPECFEAPEMLKTRAVIVISPRISGRNRELVTVVPISRSAPHVPCQHHCRIPARLLPTFMRTSGGDRWAKCDMVYTFGTRRLFPVECGPRGPHGHRAYEYPKLDFVTLVAVNRAIAAGMGIELPSSTTFRVRSPISTY